MDVRELAAVGHDYGDFPEVGWDGDSAFILSVPTDPDTPMISYTSLPPVWAISPMKFSSTAHGPWFISADCGAMFEK